MVGNTGNVGYYLAKYLRKMKCNALVMSNLRSPFIVRPDLSFGSGTQNSFITSYRYVKHVMRLAYSFDLIQVIFLSYYHAFLVPLLKIKEHKPLIVTCNGSDIRGVRGDVMLKKHTLRLADKVIVVTPDLISHIPLGVAAEWVVAPLDTQVFSPFETALYDKLHDGYDFVLFHPSINHFQKRTHMVLDAYERLKKEYKVKLVLSNQIAHEKMRHYYNAVDVVLDEFKYHILCYVSLEAMACEKPVINSFSFWDYYEVPPPVLSADSSKQIYSHLAKLLDDANLRLKLGKRGRKFVKKVYDAKLVAKKMYNLYRKTLER